MHQSNIARGENYNAKTARCLNTRSQTAKQEPPPRQTLTIVRLLVRVGLGDLGLPRNHRLGDQTLAGVDEELDAKLHPLSPVEIQAFYYCLVLREDNTQKYLPRASPRRCGGARKMVAKAASKVLGSSLEGKMASSPVMTGFNSHDKIETRNIAAEDTRD
ncbi:hypothetical protein ACJZ2D_008853 [Fusarium nematophilum]